MDSRKRARYSLRSECRDHGSCSCRNALDSMPASARQTPRRTRRSSRSSKELESSDAHDSNSDYGSISPDENYLSVKKSKELISNSDFDYDSDSMIYENIHSFTTRSIKRVTFSDIISYEYNESNKIAGSNSKTGTPKQSLNGGIKMKPRTILTSSANNNNHSSNSVKSHSQSPIPISSDTFESRRKSCDSVITTTTGGVVVAAAGMTTTNTTRRFSSSSSSTWGEKACKALKIIGFPVYFLLMMGIIVEKWFIDKFRSSGGRSGGGGGSWWRWLWGEKSIIKSALVSRNRNGDGGHGGYIITPTNNISERYKYGNVNGIQSGNGIISDDDDEEVFLTSSQKSSWNSLEANNKYSTPATAMATKRNMSLRSKITSSSTNHQNNHQVSTIRNHFGKDVGSRGEDGDDENFIRSKSNNISSSVSKRWSSRTAQQTNMNVYKPIGNNFGHDVDSYDEDEEYSASVMGSVSGGGGRGGAGGLHPWGFLKRLFVLLLLTGALIAIVYWLWPVTSSVASRTWEVVCNLLIRASEVISNTVSNLFSFIPFLFTPSKSVEFRQVPVQNPVVHGSNGISAEDYSKILKQIQDIQVTLKSHEEKLLLHETQFKSLREQILQLHESMKAVSLKDKSTEQIINEVMKASLGVASNGESVTFENLMAFIKQEGVLHRKNLEMNLNTLSSRLDDAQVSQTEKMNELSIDVNSVSKRQKDLAEELNHIKDRSPDVDIEKIKAAVLPGLLSEINTQVKLSCETRDCPESLVTGHSNTPGMSEVEVEKLIHVALSKYDSDKTGMPDLALEPAGGSILSTRCTKSSKLRNSVVSLWGFKIWSPPNNPRTIIQPGVVPGECWAFEGSIGDVVIKLISPSIITGFTMEHIPKSISPYRNIESAPKEFQVLGLNEENDFETAHDFGSYVYEDNEEPLQYFAALNLTETAYPIVELKIKSNHGNLLHTCLYRFRVHGTLVVGGAPFTATVQTEETM